MRKKTKKAIYTIIILSCSLSGNLPARNNQDVLSLFEKRFEEIDSLIFPADKKQPSAYTACHISPAFPDTTDTGLIDRLYGQREEKLIGEMRAQTGLQITGQTYYRPERKLGMDEEDGYSRYNAKLQVELGWNIFQSSVYKRKGKANAIRLANEVERIGEQQINHRLLTEKNREALQVRYDSILYGILQYRIGNLRLLNDAYMYLLDQEKISSDEPVAIMNALADAERNLAVIPKRYDGMPELSYPECKSIAVDTSTLLVYIRETNADLRKLDTRIQLLTQQQSNTNYWQNASLSPFVRYSHYYRREKDNSNNIDAGLSFRFPLSSESKRKKHVLGSEINILEARKEVENRQIEERVYFILTEIDRLNRAVGAEYRRLNELKKYLSLRGEAYDNRIREFNRLARMKEYNLYLEALEKLYYFQYQRELNLISLQQFIPDISVEEFVRNIPFHTT